MTHAWNPAGRAAEAATAAFGDVADWANAWLIGAAMSEFLYITRATSNLGLSVSTTASRDSGSRRDTA
jgi:hypothetical protein